VEAIGVRRVLWVQKFQFLDIAFGGLRNHDLGVAGAAMPAC